MWEGCAPCSEEWGKVTCLGCSPGLLRAPGWGAVVPNAPHPPRRTVCKGDAGRPGLVSGGMLPLRRGVRGAERRCPCARSSVRLSGKGLEGCG